MNYLKINIMLALVGGSFFLSMQAMEAPEENKRLLKEQEPYIECPLQQAILCGNLSKAKDMCCFLLTQAGLDGDIIKPYGETDTFYLAIEKKNCYPLLGLMYKKVEDLRKYYDYACEKKNTQAALFLGIMGNFVDDEKIKSLIERGADINARYYCKSYKALIEEPLSIRCLTNFDGDATTTLKTLIEHGANISERNSSGTYLLSLAAMMNMIPVVDLLIQKGADLEVHNGDSITSLVIAIQLERVEIAKKLINAGANVNIITSNTNSLIPETICLRHRTFCLIPLLRQKGCRGLENIQVNQMQVVSGEEDEGIPTILMEKICLN